jgi:hypothetical protein
MQGMPRQSGSSFLIRMPVSTIYGIEGDVLNLVQAVLTAGARVFAGFSLESVRQAVDEGIAFGFERVAHADYE